MEIKYDDNLTEIIRTTKRINFIPPNSYERDIYIFENPTFNCQTSCIALAYNLVDIINQGERDDIINNYIKPNSHRQFFVDVNERYAKYIIDFFKNDAFVKFEQPYHSSNDSKMVMIMFRWNDHEDDHYDEGFEDEDPCYNCVENCDSCEHS